jgi:hypothetical protein
MAFLKTYITDSSGCNINFLDKTGCYRFNFPFVDFSLSPYSVTTVLNAVATYNKVLVTPEGSDPSGLLNWEYGIDVDIIPNTTTGQLTVVRARGWVRYIGNINFTEVLTTAGVENTLFGITVTALCQ